MNTNTGYNMQKVRYRHSGLHFNGPIKRTLHKTQLSIISRCFTSRDDNRSPNYHIRVDEANGVRYESGQLENARIRLKFVQHARRGCETKKGSLGRAGARAGRAPGSNAGLLAGVGRESISTRPERVLS